MHNQTWGIILTDDGTMDTVVKCDACGAEFRYNFDGEEEYSEFVEWACDDAAGIHADDIS